MDYIDLTVVTWNTMWASGTGSQAVQVRRRLRAAYADLLIVTEGQRDLLPDGGHVIDAGTDWGYDITSHPHRRKTLVWSRWPLADVTALTTGEGAGRVVVAQTLTRIGPVRILAVCIRGRAPTSAPSDATSWSEHLECCDQIENLASQFDPRIPTIVAGDFNQRVPAL